MALAINLLLIAVFLFALVFVVQGGAKEDGIAFLKDTATKPGVHTLKSGMLYEVLKSSTNENARSPNVGDSCKTTYLGTFIDGSRFDGGTMSFAPNQVIKGWTEAMQLMAEGDKWKLYIPYELAYGERGRPPKIPGGSVLVFEIEIHKVEGPGKTAAEAKSLLQTALRVSNNDL